MTPLLVTLLWIATSIQGARPRGRSWRKQQEQSTPSTTRNEAEPNECIDACTHNVEMPNFCDYASYLWDDPSTPLAQRNNLGMAKYLSANHIRKAGKFAKTGRVYKLAYKYTNSMPSFGGRTWYTALRHAAGWLGDPSAYYEFDANDNPVCGLGLGYLDQRLMTSTAGNSGTQFHGLGHVYYLNGGYGDQQNYLFFNGFRGSDIMQEHGVSYLAVDELPPFITRAILLDVAGFVGVDILPETFQVDTNVVEDVLRHQAMSVDDIKAGDVILLYTGWANEYWFGGDPAFYFSRGPGFTLDTVLNIFGPKKVLAIGADSGVLEYTEAGKLNLPVHVHWIVCHGGFLFESMKLVEWVTDARNGEVAYQGGFYYTPAQIEGSSGGLGTPIVVV